jgi:predicted secreted hydrolase
MNKSLYYEVHVNIEPVFGDLGALQAFGEPFNFRLATFYMRKGNEDVFQDDQFFTTRATTFTGAIGATLEFVKHLQENGYTVKRYKIEDTLVDSNRDDIYELI